MYQSHCLLVIKPFSKQFSVPTILTKLVYKNCSITHMFLSMENGQLLYHHILGTKIESNFRQRFNVSAIPKIFFRYIYQSVKCDLFPKSDHRKKNII